MKKMITIAFTEYANAIRSKAFLIGLLAMPIIAALMIAVPHFTKDKVDLSARRFAVVDYSGQLSEVIEARAKTRNETEIFDRSQSAKQIRPRFHFEKIDATDDWETQTLALSERVRSGDLFAFLLIEKTAPNADSDLENEKDSHDFRLAYHTRTPTFQQLPVWLERVIGDEVQRIRFEREGLDPNFVKKIIRRPQLNRLGLASRTDSGEVEKAKKENRIATFAIPAASMFFLFMMVMSSAPALLNGVLEEKMQKIVECLISSVTPFQLMMGKLLGAMLVSLTLSTLYLAAIAFVSLKTGVIALIPIHLFLWFFVFLVLAILIFGSMFLAIGATCNEIQDAQSLMFPAMLGIMIPMMTWMPILQSPTGAFARWMTFFPPATPMIMMLRMAVPPGLPMWEILLGIVISILSTILIVMAAGKIFRIGILAQGQNASIARMIKWLLSK